MTNLIDNAVRHNMPDGDVQVATGTSGRHAVLSVTNSGQVIPPSEVQLLAIDVTFPPPLPSQNCSRPG